MGSTEQDVPSSGSMRSRSRPRPSAAGASRRSLAPASDARDAGPPNRLAPILKKVRSYNPKADTKLLERAYRFAEDAHDGQYRLSGEPYVEHPVAVTGILADLRLDTTTLTAALLHDTVEDTEVGLGDIEDGVRQRGRADRRRPHEARQARVPERRARAGRERPEDDRGDGRRHPGAARQARRPAAQHADARAALGGAPTQDRERDARDPRAAREPPRGAGAEVGARGPRVQDAQPRSLSRDREPRRDVAGESGSSSSRASRRPSGRSSRSSA